MSSVETFGIIGGGEFGGVAARYLAPAGADVMFFDQDGSAEMPNAKRATLESVATADVVLLAVPFGAYEQLVPEVAALARPDSLIVDVCSVKIRPTEVFKGNGLLDRPNVLMTHPLFGPQSTNGNGVAGTTIVVTESHGPLAEYLQGTWNDKGVNTLEMTADDHDREMAKVHVLPFIIGRSLLQMDITESPLTTGYFSKLLDLIRVERHHSPELFKTIQEYNPYAADMRSEFIATLCTLHAEAMVDVVRLTNTANPQERLQELRHALDLIDDYTLILNGLRFSVTSMVGDLKAEFDIPSVDPEREEAQRKQKAARAAELGVPEDLALAVHEMTVKEVARQHDAKKQTSTPPDDIA